MKIIIDIPEERYNEYKKIGDSRDILFEAIRKGKLLPKGHGDLIILSKDKLKENQMDLNFSCQKWIDEVGLSNATVAIIEADKESEEE